MPVSVQTQRYHLNEDGEFVTVYIYADDETGKLSIWVEDPEADSRSMLKYVPDSIEDAIEWYELNNNIKLSSSTTGVNEVPEDALEDIIVEEAEGSDIEFFKPSQAAVLDASSLARMIFESLDEGPFSGELQITFDDDFGGYVIIHGEAWATLKIAYKRG